MNPIEYLESFDARKDVLGLLHQLGAPIRDISIATFKVPKYLFRYSNINTYLLSNLTKNELTLTAPTEFNDLYDSTMHFDTVSLYKNRFKELNESSRRFGFDEPITEENAKHLIKQAEEMDEYSLSYLTKNYRISCLSSKANDIKMWSLYANCSMGICVAYDFSKSKTNLDDFIFPVIYVNKPIDVTNLCEVDKKIMEATLVSMISKFGDWQYEKEWRIIIYWPDDNDKRISIINIPSPEYIILGNRFFEGVENAKQNNREYLGHINNFIKYIEQNEIAIKIIKPQIRSYQLDMESVEIDFVKYKLNL